MKTGWDESYIGMQREDASTYWVWFWTGDDVEEPASHDPRRITGAESVAEVLAWVQEVREGRRFELFVETTERAETRTHGRTDYRRLVRLASDFTPRGVSSTITLSTHESVPAPPQTIATGADQGHRGKAPHGLACRTLTLAARYDGACDEYADRERMAICDRTRVPLCRCRWSASVPRRAHRAVTRHVCVLDVR